MSENERSCAPECPACGKVMMRETRAPLAKNDVLTCDSCGCSFDRRTVAAVRTMRDAAVAKAVQPWRECIEIWLAWKKCEDTRGEQVDALIAEGQTRDMASHIVHNRCVRMCGKMDDAAIVLLERQP